METVLGNLSKHGIVIGGYNIKTMRYADDVQFQKRKKKYYKICKIEKNSQGGEKIGYNKIITQR